MSHRKHFRVSTVVACLVAGWCVTAALAGSGSGAIGPAAAQQPATGARSGAAGGMADKAWTGADRLATVASWGYQLQRADPAQIARSPYDLVVIDYTRNGDAKRPLSPREVARMKRKPDGSRRIVLAYVSVGEAEDYRFYWDDSWLEWSVPEPATHTQGGTSAARSSGAPSPGKSGAAAGSTSIPVPPAVPAGPAEPPTQNEPQRWISAKAPPWLGDENETWRGNFAVRYWERGWQDLLFGTPKSYLDRVQSLGFDGVYLDRVDAYYEHIDEHPTAAEDMVDLVVRLAETARRAQPDFLVVPQNGEELLTRAAYVAAIDGIAKEDLLYGSPDEAKPNSSAQIDNSLGWLGHATREGRKVLVIEYLSEAPEIKSAQAEIERLGFVPYFGPRSLDRLAPPPSQLPTESGRAKGPSR